MLETMCLEIQNIERDTCWNGGGEINAYGEKECQDKENIRKKSLMWADNMT